MASATFEERMKIRTDTLAGKTPKRLFVSASFTLEAACSYAGVDLAKAHYDIELTEKAFAAICEDFYSDTLPIMNLRFPASYQILGAKNWILGSNGAVQHPEIVTMEVDDYDEFIEKPYDTMVEKFLPRVCTELDTDPVTRSLVMARAFQTQKKAAGEYVGLYIKLSGQYGFAPGMMAGELIEAPFDFLADQLRGFKEVNMDLRRRPAKVKAAVEAILPLMLRRAITPTKRTGQINFIPLHLAPYIKNSDFEKYYWPTLEELVVEQDKHGIASMLFAEEDWTRYASFLERLPKSSIIYFENGDYKKLKETVGKDHVISGFFDPTITLTRTKEQCIDAAKQIVDTCAPNGKYYFAFDRGVMDINSVDVPKLQAVLDWLHTNTDY